MSWTGFSHAVADGSITTVREYFWHHIGLNRRDAGREDPIVFYNWNEDFEKEKIKEAIADLDAFLAKTESQLREEWKENLVERNGEHDSLGSRIQEEINRVESLKNKIEEQASAVPEVLREFHETVVKQLKEGIAWNLRMTTNDEPKNITFEEWREGENKYLHRKIEYAEHDYARRKNRCHELKKFMTVAMEVYGEPPHGFEVKDSSTMW